MMVSSWVRGLAPRAPFFFIVSATPFAFWLSSLRRRPDRLLPSGASRPSAVHPVGEPHVVLARRRIGGVFVDRLLVGRRFLEPRVHADRLEHLLPALLPE